MARNLFLISLFLILVKTGGAQTNFVVIDSIQLEGNKRTKDGVIYRELDILPGDTLYMEELSQRLKENEKRIISSGLFNDINLNIKDWDENNHRAKLVISLTENWYLYPAPIFELADRNFNVWWNQQNRSLDRVNYGARFTHINLTGNRDKFKAIIQRGYTRKFELDYNYPYLNKAQTIGLRVNAFYSENREMGFRTIENMTEFYRDEQEDKIVLRRMRLKSSVSYRPGLFQFHSLSLEFHRNYIDPFIATTLNPDYFLNGDNILRFIRINYDFRYDKRIHVLYPEGGYLLGINVDKSGIGIFDQFNNFSAFVFAEQFFKPISRTILAFSVKAKTNFTRNKIAFGNNTGLGYGSNVVGGYELYVLDGTDYILSKNSARFNIIDKLIDFGRFMPVSQFKRMSLKAYLTFNFDAGYVNEPTYIETNFLNNRWIYGYGPGLDFILFNNFLFQIEYSFNQLGEKGVYIHNSISF